VRRPILPLALLALLAAVPAGAEEELTRLLRFPDVCGDKIAFVYAGDVWVVGTEGGVARRLTSHPGLELTPKFSPDCRRLAFSGEYGGTRQVFVIDVDGGEPRQLTFYNDVGPLPPRGGFDNQVLDWTPDGEKVLFLAHRLFGERRGRPYLVPAAGGMEEPLAIPEGGSGMFSPDGTRVVYTPVTREFRTWKRYRGGQASDVWIYDLKSNTAEQITHSPATDQGPTWIGDTVYFSSDRDGKYNLYAYDVSAPGSAPRQVTHHDVYDVLWPSAGPRQVVYENGGYLYLFDPAGETTRRVPIRVYGDFREQVPYFKKLAGDVESAGISPSGKRAVFAARGEVFTVPAENGEVRNLTASPGVREMDPAWSPDGRWIAYLSDRTGEYEIYLRPQDGSGPERRVTTDGGIWRFPPVWSPDSEKLAYGDKLQRLRVVDVATGATTDVDHSSYNDITTYTFSPDSRWLAYVKAGENQMPSIWVHSLDDGTSAQLTGDDTADFGPVFDPGGRYLYFLSNRDFHLTFSGFEFSYVYTDPTRVYVGLLNPGEPALLRPKSDEEAGAEPGAGDEAKAGKAAGEAAKGKGKAKGKAGGAAADGAGEVPRVEIQVAGFEERVRAIPGPSDAYRSLAATKDGVFYLTDGGPGGGGGATLKRYLIDDEKEEVLLAGISSYVLAAGGAKLLYQQGDKVGIVDAKPGSKVGDGLLPLERMELKIDPPAEWAQMFVDAWRILRDWFYDPDMHGVDWPDVRRRYGELVPFVATRSDLDFVLGEMGAELGAGHVYVQPGDEPTVERVDGGLLGAEVVADPSGYFRIAHVFPGENWHEEFRSPLTEPGVDVAAGDFVLAVDGRTTRGVDNFYRLLEARGGKVVTLTVNGKPEEEGARQVRVRTITSETKLRYLEWVQSRRRMVSEASGGRIGYIHLPDTAIEGNRELFKAFYPQASKQALIIDVRYNGGGFIPDRMVELLDRPLLNYWTQRGLALVTTPVFVNAGPKAALINGYAGSGGDAFPYYFRKLGLGPLIGTRTWGGLIGLSGNPSLLDGGSVTAPSFRFLDTDGKWAVEGVGVSPDIEVVDRPDLVAQGHDPSLEKAIEVLLAELAKNPPPQIEAPPPPRQDGG
jgi:tricorn protease